MRFSEVSRLRGLDLVFSSNYVKVFVKEIKTDIIGKECGFTSQFLIKFFHWNNFLALSKISENSEDSFLEAYVEARNSSFAQNK